MITVACVNAGNYLGKGRDYVAKLRNGVKRNLTMPYRFVCLTDDSAPLGGVEYRPLVPGVSGWWCKLQLFKPGMFSPGERIFYLDLDVVVLRNVDEVIGYSGDFAIASDFFFPEHCNSSLMAWEAGTANHLWNQWERVGRPTFDRRGDQNWVESFMPSAVRLQSVFPGTIVSFKANCLGGLPAEAKICAFHGKPRPHEVDLDWIRRAWNGTSI